MMQEDNGSDNKHVSCFSSVHHFGLLVFTSLSSCPNSF